MTGSILLCTDGSEISNAALRAGMAVVRPDLEVILATVIPASDPMLVTGTGFAGGTMSPDDFEAHEQDIESEARATLQRTAEALGLDASKGVVLRGDAGATVCEFAADQGVEVIVVGSRGHGGLKRAILGSVSDHVVRNAPCPVVVA
jgi:nucleotide-binding universal stress UspA family protein